MIVLFTDFGTDDPYVGQMKAAILARAPRAAVIDGLHAMPDRDPLAGAHLLAALMPHYSAVRVALAVVDPGVGSDRAALAVDLGGRWLIGPDNGLLSIAAARSAGAVWHRLVWRPGRLSATFHGRDLFAPLAAMLAVGEPPAGWLEPIKAPEVVLVDEPLARIIYCDHYGNAITGIPARALGDDVELRVGGASLRLARTFTDVPPGAAFWYRNSIGLVELAVNLGSCREQLGLRVGDTLDW